MTDLEMRRRSIAVAEAEVEHQRTRFRTQQVATRRRMQGWKAPLIVAGGALLGILLGRRTAPRRGWRDAAFGQHAGTTGMPSVPGAVTRIAGRTAGLWAGLSLALRVATHVLPLLQSPPAQRQSPRR